MNFFKTNVITLIFLFSSVFAFSQSQLELTQMANTKYEIADKELNLVYQQIRAKYSYDAELLRKLREAQLIWIKFRDASLEAGLFDSTPEGSMHQMEKYLLLEKLTRDRIKQLKELYMIM